MTIFPVLLVVGLSFASAAIAQTALPIPAQAVDVDCAAEQTALQAEMDVARSRGRMLQRRQLAEQLLAVQARCGTLPQAQSIELQIESLQKEVLELRKELDRAEVELRRLRQSR